MPTGKEEQGNGKAVQIATLAGEIKAINEKVSFILNRCDKHGDQYHEQVERFATLEANFKNLHEDVNRLGNKIRGQVGRAGQIALPGGTVAVVYGLIEAARNWEKIIKFLAQ